MLLVTSFNFLFLLAGTGGDDDDEEVIVTMTVAPGGVNCGPARIPIESLSSALLQEHQLNHSPPYHFQPNNFI
jgi:hypothetical protein